MTIVSPPFILDFGKAYVDQEPDFPPEVMRDWEEERAEQWAERWGEVQALLRKLESFGIRYLDAKPGNIEFEDVDASS